MSGPRLGRPKKNPSRAEKNQAKGDANYRNVIEGKFGQGKRRFSLGRVMTKLAETSECAISITILVMNLERLLWQILFVYFFYLISSYQSLTSEYEEIQEDLKRRMNRDEFLLPYQLDSFQSLLVS